MQTALILEDLDETRTWLIDTVKLAYPGIEVDDAATIKQARSLINSSSGYDLAIIDLNLPDGNGNEIITLFANQYPKTYIVVASIFDDDEHLFTALADGAQGYLLKEQSKEELVQHLKGIVNNDPPLSPSIARKILRHFSKLKRETEKELEQLTKRETEVLKYIAKGLNRKEISEVMEISPHTVAHFTKSVYKKLNVSSRAEAALEASRLGLAPQK